MASSTPRSGASLTAMTLVAALTTAALYGVLAPKPATLSTAPLVTVVELSISRTDRLFGVPL